MSTKLRRTSMLAPVAAAAALAVGMAPGAGATTASSSSSSSAGLTSFHGTVTSVSTANRTFRIRRGSGSSLTFRVTSATVYERLSGGLSSLRGKAIEVKGRKVNGRWTARKVEPDTDRAGDDNGGGGGGGADDGPNHDAGDDHGGGGGHGSDD